MAPFLTVQPAALCGVQPSRVLPSNIETRFGSPYGLGSATALAAGAATPARSSANPRMRAPSERWNMTADLLWLKAGSRLRGRGGIRRPYDGGRRTALEDCQGSVVGKTFSPSRRR